jgi:predicted dehydrogenase
MSDASPVVDVVLIGCGAVADLYHAPALAWLERQSVLRVAGVFDPDERAAARLASRFRSARRMESAAASEHAAIAIVASPPAFHARQTIEALNRGAAVLCEKPMAISVTEAGEMAAAAAAAGMPLAISFVRRFLPAARTIRAILRRRLMGDIRHITCFEGGVFRWPAQSAAFFERGRGGGVLADMGVHMIDLLVWWLGTPAHIDYEDDAMGGVEANCRCTLHYKEFTVTGRLSRDWDLPNRYFIDCVHGWISWTVTEPESLHFGFHDAAGAAIEGRLYESAMEFGCPAPGPGSINFEQCFVAQIQNVIQALRGTAPLIAPAAAGVESMRIIDQCYRDRKLMKMGWLSDREWTRAQALATVS